MGNTIGCLGGMSSSLLVQLHGWCEQPHRTSASVLIYFLGSTITQCPQTLSNIGRWIMVHSFCFIHQVCLTMVRKISMASALARYARVTSIRQDRQVSTIGSRLSPASLDREWRSLVQCEYGTQALSFISFVHLCLNPRHWHPTNYRRISHPSALPLHIFGDRFMKFRMINHYFS